VSKRVKCVDENLEFLKEKGDQVKGKRFGRPATWGRAAYSRM